MEVTAKYLGDAQFEAEARGHKVVSDQPLDNGGADEAMTPPELMLASIATCAAYYAVHYLKRHNLPTANIEVKVSAEKAKNPARLDAITILVEAPCVETEQHAEGVRKSVEKCLVKNTLAVPPSMEVRIHSSVRA